MKINGSIIHATYTDDIEKQFQKIFTDSLNNFKNIVFPSKDMIKRLRVTATEMSLACEYVIGLSLFLNGEINKAEIIFSEVIKTEILRQYFINHPQSIDKYTFLQNSAFTHWVKEKCSKMC